MIDVVPANPLTPSNLKVVVCRPAREADTVAVMELTRTIWGGHDYIPYVWNEWLADPDGLLAVAEYGGVVAGLNKLSRGGADQWWMEGLRVAPEQQGKRIASRLFEFILGVWEKSTPGPIRLMTSHKRLPVHHLCDRNGFRKVGEYAIYAAPSIPDAAHNLVQVPRDQAGQILERFRRSPLHPYHHGLFVLGWKYVEPDLTILEQAVDENHLWEWQDGLGRLAFFEDDDDGNRVLYISFLDCPPEKVSLLLQDFRRLASGLGFSEARWTAPLYDPLVEDLTGAGFNLAWEDTLLIYEKSR